MAIKGSGTSLSFSEIRTEFGPNVGSTGVSLGRYRNSDSNFSNKNVGSLTDLPLDTGIPKTGQIKVSDFYSKKLNIIVDFYSGDTTTRVSASDRYGVSGGTKVVGGYTSRPSSPAGKRVIVNVNKKIGSETGGNDRCALRTGGWPLDSSLEIEIGTNGKIYGAGGDGGTGGSGGNGNGSNGEAGSSALGVETSRLTKINNLGRIQAGYGGGGGGGGKSERRKSGKKSSRRHSSTGGGGGAGAGYPNGNGGSPGSGQQNEGTTGSAGGDGTDNTSGARGAGGVDAGYGGKGGVVNNSSTKGEDGQSTGGSGGTAGNNGYAIMTSQGSLPTITGNAVIGRTITNSNPQ
tara:strand:- start:1232 stop:2269 length:1038 start_codon:yes stop_codon:yes gene_type:complete